MRRVERALEDTIGRAAPDGRRIDGHADDEPVSDQERYRRFFLWRAAVLPLWIVIGLIQGTWWIAAAGIVGTLAIVGMAMARKRQRERAARR